MRKHLLAVLLLVAAVWFLYFQTGGFEFLRFDDPTYTYRCSFVHNGLSADNIFTAVTTLAYEAIWMPLTSISYMADITLFGPGPGPHHLVNVLIHSLNAVLLYLLLFRLVHAPGRGPTASPSAPTVLPLLLAGAVWALHPQRAEAVAWIAGRKELLCTLFVLLGLLCWLRDRGENVFRRRLARIGAYLCCTLACMSKPTAMCFPFLAFAVTWLSDGCARLPGADGRRTFPRAGLRYLPLLLLAGATGALAIHSQTHAEGYAVRDLFSASLPWRLLNAAVSLGLYIFQAVVPAGIHLDYRAVPGHFPLHGILGLSALLVTVLALAAVLRRRRAVLPLLLFFLAALAPTLGVFGSFGEHARADRFLYLPAVAFSIGLAGAVGSLWNARATATMPRRLSAILSVTGACVALFYLCASFPVVASYRNDFTAFSRTLDLDPDHGRALAHVASEECARFGRIDRGVTLYRRSQELRPRDDTAAQLAYALALRGLSSDYAEIRRLCAKFACDHALDRKGQALEALGMTAMRQRRWKEAISCLEDSVKAPLRFYSSEDARLRLGACLCNARRPEDAIRVFEPLAQSARVDIRDRARQALATLKANPKAVLFF